MKVMTQTGVCLLWWLLAVLVLAVSLGYLGGLHRSNGQVGKMDRSKKAVTLSQTQVQTKDISNRNKRSLERSMVGSIQETKTTSKLSGEQASSKSHSGMTENLEEKAVRQIVFPHLSPYRLKRIFCNFNAHAAERSKDAAFNILDADGRYCTDFNYYHAEVQDYHLRSVSKLDVLPHVSNVFLPGYTALNDLKMVFPKMRTFLTLTESEQITFSGLVIDRRRNRQFVYSCVYNLRLWGFDGLIIKWLFPRGKAQLTQLLADLRNAFEVDAKKQPKGVDRLLLGAILTGQAGMADVLYEVDTISNIVDHIIVLAFDESPSFSGTTRLINTLYAEPSGLDGENNTGSCFNNTTTDEPFHDSTTASQDNVTNLNTSGTDSSKEDGVLDEVNKTMDNNNSSAGAFTDSNSNIGHRAETGREKRDETHENISRHSFSQRRAKYDRASMKLYSVTTPTTTDAGMRYMRNVMENLDLEELNGTYDMSNDTNKEFSVQKAVEEWSALGADKSKLIIGLSLIGQGYIKKNSSDNSVGAPVTGPSPPKASNKSGQLFFYEMCKLAKTGTVRRASDTDLTPYWYDESTWVSYEDLNSITQKVSFLRESHVLGVMLFSQSEDDFKGDSCGMGKFPASQLVYNISSIYLDAPLYGGTPVWLSFCRSCARVSLDTSLPLFLGGFVVCIFLAD